MIKERTSVFLQSPHVFAKAFVVDDLTELSCAGFACV